MTVQGGCCRGQIERLEEVDCLARQEEALKVTAFDGFRLCVCPRLARASHQSFRQVNLSLPAERSHHRSTSEKHRRSSEPLHLGQEQNQLTLESESGLG